MRNLHHILNNTQYVNYHIDFIISRFENHLFLE